jgi:malonyl-CoA O-methyltransferase
MKYDKKEIIRNFSQSVDYYTDHAVLQKQTAFRLAKALEPWQYSIPDGPVLEIGAGTGFFTEHLVTMFSSKKMEITDASPEMVNHCKKTFNSRKNLSFNVLDAEEHEWKEEAYSMITGNFVAQWFKDPSVTLSKMAKSLKPGGFMLMSFPGSESYPQWRKYCLELGIPFTANKLPDIEQIVVNLSMGPVKVDFYEDQSTETYNDVYSFFRHLKQTGTSTAFSGKSLKPKQLRLLNDYWLQQNNGSVKVHYHTAFLAVKKDL